jgi:hypothetical protein
MAAAGAGYGFWERSHNDISAYRYTSYLEVGCLLSPNFVAPPSRFVR